MRNPIILVIGNGPSVLSPLPSKSASEGPAVRVLLGKCIDRCDEIMRFNDYRLRGYREQLGRRTTVWIKSGPSQPEDAEGREVKNTLMVVSPGQTRKYPMEPVIPRRMSIIKGHNYPSAGLAVLDNLVKQGIIPFILGFDQYKAETPRRYWDAEPAGELADRRSAEPGWIENHLEAGKLLLFRDYAEKVDVPVQWRQAREVQGNSMGSMGGPPPDTVGEVSR